MKLRKLVCAAGLASLSVLLAFSCFAVPQAWLDPFVYVENFDSAKKSAAAEGKYILVAFSADWCGFCKLLEKEVLSKREFITKASENCVLLFADMSHGLQRDKRQTAPWASELAAKFSVNGFPTLLLFDASGRKISVFGGYEKGGPAVYLKWISSAIAPKDGSESEASQQPGSGNGEVKARACGKDCCKVKICPCCRKNGGKCCPDNGAPPGSFPDSEKVVPVEDVATNVVQETERDNAEMATVRHVNGYELRIDDASLAKELDKLAEFFEKVSNAFNRETGGYYIGQKHYYAGILLHADAARRGEKSKFIGSRRFYSMYLPQNVQDKSWCYFLCDSFLPRMKDAGQKEMHMYDQMLVYVGYRVAAAIGLDGAEATLASVGEDKKGVKRLMCELSKIKPDAIPEYYKAKVRLAETERIGLVVPVHDVAEIFSGVVGKDVFGLFAKFGLSAQRKKVSPRIVGFSAEFTAGGENAEPSPRVDESEAK